MKNSEHVSGNYFELKIDKEKRDLSFWYRLVMTPSILIIGLWVAHGFYSLSPVISVLILLPTVFISFPLIIVTLNSFNEKQEITVNRNQVNIKKKRKFFTRQITIATDDINAVKLKQINLSTFENFIVWLKVFRNFVDLPSIESKKRTFFFGEFNLNKADREELIEKLNKAVR